MCHARRRSALGAADWRTACSLVGVSICARGKIYRKLRVAGGSECGAKLCSYRDPPIPKENVAGANKYKYTQIEPVVQTHLVGHIQHIETEICSVSVCTPRLRDHVRRMLLRLFDCTSGPLNRTSRLSFFFLRRLPCPSLPFPSHRARRKHYVHCLVMALARPALDKMDQGAYEKLRRIYNRLDIPGPNIVPPGEMEISKLCEHPFCR